MMTQLEKFFEHYRNQTISYLFSHYIKVVDNLALALTVSLWAGMAIFILRAGSDVLALTGVAKRFPARPSYVLPWLTVNLAGIVVQSMAAFAGAAASFTLMSGGFTAGKFVFCYFLHVGSDR